MRWDFHIIIAQGLIFSIDMHVNGGQSQAGA